MREFQCLGAEANLKQDISSEESAAADAMLTASSPIEVR